MREQCLVFPGANTGTLLSDEAIWYQSILVNFTSSIYLNQFIAVRKTHLNYINIFWEGIRGVKQSYEDEEGYSSL